MLASQAFGRPHDGAPAIREGVVEQADPCADGPPFVHRPAPGAQLALVGHLLALVIRALDRHPPERAVFRHQLRVAAAPKARKRKLHIVKIRRLLKVCLSKVRRITCKSHVLEQKGEIASAGYKVALIEEYASVELGPACESYRTEPRLIKLRLWETWRCLRKLHRRIGPSPGTSRDRNAPAR